MPKRLLLLLSLLGLALTAGAVAPWSVSWPGLSSGVEGQLHKAFGLDLVVTGRSTVAFLPVPRVKFDGVAVNAPDGTPLISGGQMRGEFRIWPLFVGQFKLTELTLTGARINVAVDAEGRGPWSAVLARIQHRLTGDGDASAHLRRLILADTTIVVTETPGGRQSILDDVSLVLRWPDPKGAVELAGTLSWRGETLAGSLTELVPAALLEGHPSRVQARIEGPVARFTLSGDLTARTDLRFEGRAAFETGSLREFGRWSGLQLPLGSVLGATAIEGPFTAEARVPSWPKGASWTLSSPAIRVQIGSDRLDGALVARGEGGRLGVTGTLAADSLALSDLLGAPTPRAAGWSADAIDLTALTGADLDLRLSAAAARLGTLRLADLAGSLLVKPGRVEASLGRASLGGGSVKGRVSLNANAAGGLDLRLHSSFDRVDVGTVLAELGQPRWLGGTGGGQVLLESTGESAADLARHAQGRGSVLIRSGEIGGVNLADVLRRAESRPLSAFLDWRGGRTAFEQVQQSWTMSAGIADLEGTTTSPGLQGAVQGRVSVVERSVALRAKVEAASRAQGGEAPALVFDLVGPWDNVAVVPDARALIERSGAARPLLPPREANP